MKNDGKVDKFIKTPIYKGGGKAMTAFIYSQLRYPKDAFDKNIEGVVYCKYDIDYLGNVTDVKVIKSLGHGCDEEAIRVIKLMKFDVPKNPRGLKILFHKDIKIQFKKPEVKTPNLNLNPPQQTQQFQYNYVVTNSKNSVPNKDVKEKTINYNYTIKIN